MLDDDESRWKHFHPDVPRRTGKIRNLEKFDAVSFGVMDKHANKMDPQLRILLEHSYEAIIDSGTSPASLAGSKTGVFVACSLNDAHDAFTYQVPGKNEMSMG
jgi:fatty acid synthase, animal type